MRTTWHLPLLALLWLAATSEGARAVEVCPQRIDLTRQPGDDAREGWRLYDSEGQSSNPRLADVAFFGSAPRSGQVQEVLAPVATRRAGSNLHSAYAFGPPGVRVWVGCTYRDGEAFVRFARQLGPTVTCEVDREGSRVTRNACALAPMAAPAPVVTPVEGSTGQGLELEVDRGGALYVVNRTGTPLRYSGNFVSGVPLPDGDLVLQVETTEGMPARHCVVVDRFGPTLTLAAGARAPLGYPISELRELFCLAPTAGFRLALRFVRWTPRDETVLWSSNMLEVR